MLDNSPALLTPPRILYLTLRAVILCVGILLGFLILSAVVVSIPFYANEGNTVQFQDRIRGLIGDCLFFIAIIIPYRWTVATPYHQLRVGLVIIAAAWVLMVDMMAYAAGLTWERFTLFSWSAIIVAVVLCITLFMRRAREHFGRV